MASCGQVGRQAGPAGSYSSFPSYPLGSKTRKIPYPTKNPFTWLFLLVSCPNYTYEVRGSPTALSSSSWGLWFPVEGPVSNRGLVAWFSSCFCSLNLEHLEMETVASRGWEV